MASSLIQPFSLSSLFFIDLFYPWIEVFPLQYHISRSQGGHYKDYSSLALLQLILATSFSRGFPQLCVNVLLFCSTASRLSLSLSLFLLFRHNQGMSLMGFYLSSLQVGMFWFFRSAFTTYLSLLLYLTYLRSSRLHLFVAATANGNVSDFLYLCVFNSSSRASSFGTSH